MTNKRVLFKDLREVFKDYSLKSMETHGNNPMPHDGNEFYIWNDLNDESKCSMILNKNKVWKIHYSKNNYISLQDSVYKNDYHCIEYGPNSQSSSNTVRFVKIDGLVLITASGWGTSSIWLWEGSENELLSYLIEKQVNLNTKE